ncbi:MAG TPA: prephenate dehydratase [Syntrophomonadaceae bacterium]|nr:prephenate dehydratase [Syntrophomonadaceae bacterium]
MAYAVLGPRGTFSEEAAQIYWGDTAHLCTVSNIPELFALVESGQVAGGLVPIDNTMAGSIEPTMDCLASNHIAISGEISIPIQQHLMACRKYQLEEIELLISQPAALQQCEEFIRENMPGVRTEIADSTTRAAQLAMLEKRPAAAIANRQAAQLYGLQIICPDIAGAGNVTRFIHITQETEKDQGEKCSLIFSLADRPGALYETLGVFARRNINMAKIESRPNRRHPASFWFYVELTMMEGRADREEMLRELKSYCDSLKYLGSYKAITCDG